MGQVKNILRLKIFIQESELMRQFTSEHGDGGCGRVSRQLREVAFKPTGGEAV